jgi:hypothetical protein
MNSWTSTVINLSHLNSDKLVTRNIVHEIPVTDVVIKAVETMAYAQGFKTLKFKNRNGIIFQDADWIAGVDYDDDQAENDDSDDVEADHQEEDDENNDNEQELEPTDPGEIEDIILDAREEHNPTLQDGNDPNETEEDQEDQQEEPTRRSTRETRPIERLEPAMTGQSYQQTKRRKVSFEKDESIRLEYCHNLIAQTKPDESQIEVYDPSDAMLVTRLIDDLNNKITTQGASFAQQYLIKKGLKVFGHEGRNAAVKEMDQLYRRNCFTPVSIAEMSPIERRKAQQAIMFLTEKRDKSIKGRMVFNGKPTRELLSREDSASPTAALESIMLTAVIDSTERRDVMTCDIPNAFIQAEIPEVEPGEERVMMKITGVLVDMLVEINPTLYGPHVVYEKRGKVLYVQVLRAIYGMLLSAILWYRKLCGGLESEGLKFNPYDPCVANQPKKGSQQTIIFHVDDLKSSHKDARVNDQFDKWLQIKYGEHGKVTTHCGKIHEYLGMELDYTEEGKVKIGMIKYVENTLKEFPIKFTSTDKRASPAGDSLFNQGQGKKLEEHRAETYHTFTAKGLFLCKRSRPDIQPMIDVLCTRVKELSE